MDTRIFADRRLAAFVLATALTLSACTQPDAPRPPGAIAITGTTVVAELSVFGFGVSIDSATPIPVNSGLAISHTATGLAAGRHTVELRQLPSNCTSGADTRTVELRGGDTVGVRFDVVCVRTTGDVSVKVTTTGLELDPDGYRLRVDDADRGALSVNGQMMLERVQPGTRTVALTGVASNCSAQGSLSRAIGVTSGSQLTVEFAIACRATTGIILLRNTITGADPDPDGVFFTINGTRVPVGVTSQLSLRTPVGQHTVVATDVEANCTLSGAATTPVTIAGGDTVIVAVAESCTAIGGGVEGFVTNEPANDTLPRTSSGTAAALDVRRVSGRYANGFLLLTLRFAGPIVSSGQSASNSLYGWLDLDVDENTATGVSPGVNSFGGSAQQGVDFELSFFGTSVNTAYLIGVNGTLAAVATVFDGDSVTVKIPLAKIGGDDGNLTISGVFGTIDRPTDIVPNAGQVLARRPASAAALTNSTMRDGAEGNGLVPAAKAATLGVSFPRWPK